MKRYFDDSDIYGIQILWTSVRGIDTGSKETDADTDICIRSALERAGFSPLSSAVENVDTVDCNDEDLKNAVFNGMDQWWNDAM